jgi:hypothetical protein
MQIETAAAILTKLAFEQNNELRSRLSDAQADGTALVVLMMPLFRRILRQMQEDLQASDTFPSFPAPAAPDSGQ